LYPRWLNRPAGWPVAQNLLFILLLANDRALMGELRNGRV